MSDADAPVDLDLAQLAEGCPALTPSAGQSLAEAATVCLTEQGHLQTTLLTIEGAFTRNYRLFRLDLTEQMHRCYLDPEEATELGACGIAILLMRDLTEWTIVERSRKGTGFDYWLGSETEQPFQRKARLEVSGIRSGDESILAARVRRKIRQTQRSDGGFPAYIVVVEFSGPTAQVVRR